MKYRWSIAPPQPALAEFLAKQLQISPLLAQCLLNRGFSEPEPISRFLDPRLANLADPFLLPNMREAVERLFHAHARGEALVIFGDYDVDGVTSTAMLHEFMTALGWKVNYYLPHRMEEGYGLSQSGVENCLEKFPVTLFLAVDCGSTACAQIAWLRERGVDVIVLDHHQISEPPPDAIALVNPQLKGAFPRVPNFTELCSAGLAFKLCHALLKHARAIGTPGAQSFDLRPLLDLVALGTIADLVPLTGENRILVSAGLQRLNVTQRPGLLALKEVAAIKNQIGGYEVGFQLAPRLNAAGRLETAEDALHLLLARDVADAMPLAQRLDSVNRERQSIERGISEQAIGAIRARFDAARDFVLVEGQLLWHIGVVGIVASRVLHEFYRPTIIIGGEGEEWRGSGRSIDGFDLAAALRQCTDLLVKHGGHAMAAGLSIRADKLDAFRERINDIARRCLKPEQLQPLLRIDGEVSICDMTVTRIEELNRLQQTGMGNPGVQLVARNVGHGRALQRMGGDKQHAKMWITDGDRTCEAVLWGVGDGALPVGKFDLAFAPQINRYNGNTSVQLKVLDWNATN
ncbi:MAG TPA: single-stranded-DNA-specific exonuclease RecJ [Candidatus Acidoferrum sp.]|nr:single-stranded-DNA-specific exonuclease RecJ [Candidatus Acidoferrum sp.]